MYADVKMVLEVLIYLLFLAEETTWPHALPVEGEPAFPDSVEAAVDLVMADLPLKTRAAIARLDAPEIQALYFAWVDLLRFRLGLDRGNPALMQACRSDRSVTWFTIEDAAMVVIKAVKSACEQACRLRVVK
jgi:hypothetical protein